MRGIVQSISKKEYMRYIVYMAERASRQMRRMNRSPPGVDMNLAPILRWLGIYGIALPSASDSH